MSLTWRNRYHRDTLGYTLVEMLIVSAVIGVVLVMLGTSWHTLQQSMSQADARNQLKSIATKILDQLGKEIPSTVRFFGRGPSNLPFVSRVDLSGDPALLPGSLVTKSDSSRPWQVADEGNSLMFANSWKSVDVVSGTSTVKIELFKFHYYYLAYGSGTVINARERHLYHWISLPYVNLGDVAKLGDPLKAGIISGLVGQGINWAADLRSVTPTDAFWQLNSGGTLSADAGHLIRKDSCENLTQGTERTVGSYRIGVAPNVGASEGLQHIVPQLTSSGSAVGEFPSGFELAFYGNRFLEVRLVLAAKGAFPKPQTIEAYVKLYGRDVW